MRYTLIVLGDGNRRNGTKTYARKNEDDGKANDKAVGNMASKKICCKHRRVYAGVACIAVAIMEIRVRLSICI